MMIIIIICYEKIQFSNERCVFAMWCTKWRRTGQAGSQTMHNKSNAASAQHQPKFKQPTISKAITVRQLHCCRHHSSSTPYFIDYAVIFACFCLCLFPSPAHNACRLCIFLRANSNHLNNWFVFQTLEPIHAEVSIESNTPHNCIAK